MDACASGPCDSRAVCSSGGGGGYICTCAVGFTGSGSPGGCADVDECKGGSSVVCGGGGAACVNSVGSYSCSCGRGFAGRPCRDVDECRDFALHQCSPSATCVNTQGSYQCACRSGFSGDGRVCQRSDPCARMRAECDQDAYCTHSLASGPRCVCKEGFTGDGFSCRGFPTSASNSTGETAGI